MRPSVLILLIGTAAALTFNTLPALKMHQSGMNLEESKVIVDNIDINGNKKVNSLDVTINNTDTADHTVNLYASLEDGAATEIGSGESTGNTITAGTTSTITIALSTKPPLVDVANIIVTVKEV